MRTPTPRSLPGYSPRSRGFGTLIGNGWLREQSQRMDVPRWDQLRGGKSAMRKCMFLEVPEHVRAAFPVVSALPPVAPRPQEPVLRSEDIVPHRRDPRRDARAIPAFDLRAANDARVQHAARVQEAQRVALDHARHQARAAASKPPMQWWEDPVALGSLLILVPPVGLAAVWSSKRYSSDARWALTVMTGLTMCLMSAVVIAALVMH